jgi:rhodanese-related sulfurtransferase
MSSRLDAMLLEARAGLWRVTPREAASAAAAGALIVDTRPEDHRRLEGRIPGALVVERNVLEWRLDPTGDHRTPRLRDADQVVVLVCDEGYASSLAAATLQSLGLVHATDMVGGFRAWAETGLPVEHDGPGYECRPGASVSGRGGRVPSRAGAG